MTVNELYNSQLIYYCIVDVNVILDDMNNEHKVTTEDNITTLTGYGDTADTTHHLHIMKVLFGFR